MKGLRARDLLRLRRINQNQHMEVAVAHVADNWGNKPTCVRIPSGLRQTFSQPRYWHANVRDHRARARTQAHSGIQRIVASVPETAALFRRLRPFETATVMIGGDDLRRFRVFGDARVRSVAFGEQRWRLAIAEL